MNGASVTVLLPVRDGAATLDRALASVFPSLQPQDEVLVVDDGSTDETPAILARWAAAQPALRILRHEVNRGLRAALNAGLKGARGELIARIDADDEWLPGHLAGLRAAMAPPVKLVSSGYVFCAEGRDGRSFAPPDIKILIRDNWIAHSSVIVRRAALCAIGGYAEATFEDYATWIRLVDRPDEYRPAPEVTVRVHVLPNSLSRMNRARALGLRYALQRQAWDKYRPFLTLGERFRYSAVLAASRLRLLRG